MISDQGRYIRAAPVAFQANPSGAVSGAADTFHWAAVALVVALTAYVLSMAAGTAALASFAQGCGFVSAAVAAGLTAAGLLLLVRGRSGECG
jgi:hypothetical protein